MSDSVKVVEGEVQASRRKNRTSLGERGDKYRDELRGRTSVSKNNKVEVKDLKGFTYDKLEEAGASRELVDLVGDVLRDVDVAVKDVVGEAIIDHILDNDDVALMEYRDETPFGEVGVSVVRPTGKKVTRKHWRAATTFYTGYRNSDVTSDIFDDLCGMYED